MREYTFEKPTVRKVLSLAGVDLPERLSSDFLLNLINQEVLIPVGQSYEEAVDKVNGIESGKQVAFFTQRFEVTGVESNRGIKSLSDLVKIDSRNVLSRISEEAPQRLTQNFAARYKIWPHTLIKNAMNPNTGIVNIENPPIGYYWVGSDRHPKATTWTRATAGAEMKEMKNRGAFNIEVLDKTPYGRNLRVKVRSRTEEGKDYEFTVSRLPISTERDPRQYSMWLDIGHNSSDPDASYRGEEHQQRVQTINLFSASVISAIYEAMTFVKQHSSWRQFRINPFPIPANKEMVDYVDNLRLASLIMRESGEIDVLNKTEMDKIIGARIIAREYDDCFYHWGNRNTSFLFSPAVKP